MKDLLQDVQIMHPRFDAAWHRLHEVIELVPAGEGAIIPLLGPTRCGKTRLLKQLREQSGREARGDGVLFPECDVAIGAITAKPTEGDLYRAILRGLGHRVRPKERDRDLRERACQTIADQGTRIVCLDEISHCAELGANLTKRSATDHLKALVDRTGIILILSGLPKFEKLIQENEQFRDRAMRTIDLHPYQWSESQDRDDFVSGLFPLYNAIVEGGYEIEMDMVDLIRRLYGASGGRIGVVVRMLRSVLRLSTSDRRLSRLDFEAGEERIFQRREHLPRMFGAEEPTDLDLERAYVSVMQEADLPIRAASIQTVRAVRSAA